MRVKPTSGEYQLLISKMLDVLSIKGCDGIDAYVETVAWTLGDVWRANWESDDIPEWVPIPALAKTIKRIWEDRASWDNFGKPPPLPDIVDRSRNYRRDLAMVRG